MLEAINEKDADKLFDFGGPLDVGLGGAGQAADDRTSHGLRNGLHRFEVAVARDREARFDDVDAESLELARQGQLLVQVHAAARRLLAVTQGRVEDEDLVPQEITSWGVSEIAVASELGSTRPVR